MLRNAPDVEIVVVPQNAAGNSPKTAAEKAVFKEGHTATPKEVDLNDPEYD